MFVLDGFDILERLYDGPRSTVFRAIHEGERVVVKTAARAFPRPEQLAQLQHEFELGRTIDHPSIIGYHSVVPAGSSCALVTEDFGAHSLIHELDAPLPLQRFLDIAAPAAHALAVLHDHDIVHKDINPGNILINPKGTVKLADLGLASRIPRAKQALVNPDHLEGTLSYISPEQTGRMNRAIDYRSDFYSLGITYYRMLAGRVPFSAEDPMSLLHAQLAREATPLDQLDLGIPAALSDLVARLMMKTAEDRYQSARGIAHDLEAMAAQLAAGQAIDLELRQRDHAAIFRLSEQLYGREVETHALLECFERASQGRCELVLVKGFSGIGKSMLVNEVHKPMVSRRGMFASGKFDQLAMTNPLSAVLLALNDLLRQILTEDEAGLARWRTIIGEAVGVSAQVLVDVLPDLELILGPQPAVAEVGPTEAAERFDATCRAFIRSIARPEHPLALFLDDLQWVDGASLRLLGDLVSGSESRNLLVICAFRHNEVPASHPFQILLDRLTETSDVVVTALQLDRLAFDDLSQLVGDSLGLAPAAVEDISRLIEAKTAGNPFFVTQFLRTLADERLLRFDHSAQSWTWDLDEINQLDVLGSVVELMVGKMRRYGDDAQLLISLAACLGNTFDLETLSIISELSLKDTAQGLWEPIRDGLLFPLDRSYRFYQWSAIDHKDAPVPDSVLYKFSHDRIQESSLRLIGEGEFERVNLNIGRLLHQRLDAEAREERIFDLANHFNIGRAYITDEERALLRQLNLEAGLRAKHATAFADARDYIAQGMALLADDCWETDNELAFLLHRERVDTEFLSGDFEAAEHWFQVAREGTSLVRHLGDLFQLMIRIWLQADRVFDATELGVEACGVFGIDLPDSAEERDALIAEELAVFDAYMEGRELSELLERPLMDDPEMAVILAVLHETWSAAVMAGNGHVVAWSALKTITVALEQGNSVYSSGGYIALAHILSIHHRYQEADAIGRMALEMAQRFDDPLLIPKVNNTYCNFVSHLVHHTNICLPIYEESYRNALLSGDSWWGSWAVGWLRCARLICGYPLEEVLDVQGRFHEYIVSSDYSPLAHYSCMDRQIVLCLLGRTETPFSFTSADYDCAEYLNYFESTGFGYALHLHYLYMAMVHWLHGRNEGTPELLALAEKHKDHIPLLMPWPDHFFYTPIVLAPHAKKHPEHLETMRAHLAQLEHWQENNPSNYDHRVALVQAEIARVTGDPEAAFALYEVAIKKARQNDFTQHEAMANELAGRAWLAQGRDRAATGYLLDAHLLYGRWGAATKVELLEEEFPRLLAKRNDRPGDWAVVSTSTTVELHDLDLMTVMKVSQAISGELSLDRLLERVLRLSLENAGAQRASLVMVRDGRPFVEATAEVEGEMVRPSEVLNRSARVPRTAVQYVLRTSESVVVDSVAGDRMFGSDPYFRQHPVKSLMCVPSTKQGRVVAVLVLENDRAAGAFTKKHLQLLDLVSGQMAIALDNAVLYDTLEQKVEARTQELLTQTQAVEARNHELRRAQAALIQSEKMASLGQLVAGVAHEINNPITFISSGLPSLRRDVDKIVTCVPTYERDRRFDKVYARIIRLIDAIKQGAERTASVVNDLRVFSRHDEAAFKAADVEQALDATLTLHNHRMLTVKVVREYGGLPEVECYVSQMNQVFTNLIGNAIEAMADGGGTLTLRTRALADEVQIEVVDTGCGMDEETRTKAFDHFFTTRKVGEGTGLGLSTAHEIVERHAGRIEVESEVGKGSTFRICIPIHQAHQGGEMSL